VSTGRPLPNHFDILTADRTVSVALRRWALQSGHRLDWQARIDAPVTGELTLDTLDFPEAAGRVIASLRASGYPLQLEASSDRAWRVVQNN
jgi:hypothetical protein